MVVNELCDHYSEA